MAFEIARRKGISLARQIYMHFKQEILAGNLKPDEKLLSTRSLAGSLCVARNTVCEAYDMLLAEGYIYCRPGAAARVSGDIETRKEESMAPVKTQIKEHLILADFKTGQPDIRSFPLKLWQDCLVSSIKNLPVYELNYTGPEGLPKLREEIAGWLYRSRSMKADPEDIYITAGATQALHLLAGLLKTEHKKIVMEDPCHKGMLRVLQAAGCEVDPVPADERGMVTDKIDGENACAVYVTPSHQFPLGGILPAGRRSSLISMSRRYGFYIIEDDYDSEFRYCGLPVSPFYTMDHERVIYVGTFSKIMFPAIRIGYIVLPKALRQSWRRVRTYADVQNPPYSQAALAQFLENGQLERHIHKMCRIYGQRRKLFLTTLKDELGETFIPWGDEAGLHIALQFPKTVFDGSLKEKAEQYGVRIKPLDDYCICKGAHADKLLAGYGHLEDHEIKSGVKKLRSFLFQAGYLN